MNLTTMIFRRLMFVIAALMIGLGVTAPAHAEATYMVSATSQGQAGDGLSGFPGISDDGRYVAFQSAATNLVAADANARTDIFLFDRQSNAMTRISAGTGGAEANGDSSGARVSGDGRYVAFESIASNLVANDTNIAQDIFVYDRSNGATVRVSVATGGTQSDGHSLKPAISSNGRYVVFVSYASNLAAGDTNGVSDVFLHDRDPDADGIYDESDAATTRISVSTSGTQQTGASDFPAISRDGRYVAFSSAGTTLTTGGDTNGVVEDIYLVDRQRNTLERISLGVGGVQGNAKSTYAALSNDGRYVAFSSESTNLVGSDTNSLQDIFVRDRTLGTTVRASVSSSEAQSGSASVFPAISADGRYVAFLSESSSLYTRAMKSSPTALDAVSGATGSSGGSTATIPKVVYLRDLTQNSTVRVSSNNSGSSANGSSDSLAMTADGAVIAFGSAGSNLACSGDSNNVSDVFVRDLNAAALSCGTSSTPTPTPSTSGGGSVRLYALLVLAIVLIGFRNVAVVAKSR